MHFHLYIQSSVHYIHRCVTEIHHTKGVDMNKQCRGENVLGRDHLIEHPFFWHQFTNEILLQDQPGIETVWFVSERHGRIRSCIFQHDV